MDETTERKTRSLLLRMTRSEHDLLTALAARRGLSMAAVLRLALVNELTGDSIRTDGRLPAIAALVAVEHVRHLLERITPNSSLATAEARAQSVTAALQRLDEITEALGARW